MSPIQVDIPNMKLSERAMLANLSIGQWTARKKDRQVTLEVTSDKGAVNGSGSWWTKLISDSTLNKVAAAAQKARDTHRELTLDWLDDKGPRILPGAMYDKYVESMNAVKDELDAAIEPFLSEYPNLVAKARGDLGSLFVAKNYPSVEAVRAKFYFRMRITAVPETSHLRCQLDDDILQACKENMEAQANEAISNMSRDLWQRLFERVTHMAESLSRTKKGSAFHATTLQHVIDLTELLPSLNVAGDRALDDMRNEVIEKLTKHDVTDLRKNKSIRRATAKAASEIASKIDAYLSPPVNAASAASAA